MNLEENSLRVPSSTSLSCSPTGAMRLEVGASISLMCNLPLSRRKAISRLPVLVLEMHYACAE